jgi:hypothetical protein
MNITSLTGILVAVLVISAITVATANPARALIGAQACVAQVDSSTPDQLGGSVGTIENAAVSPHHTLQWSDLSDTTVSAHNPAFHATALVSVPEPSSTILAGLSALTALGLLVWRQIA